MRLFQLSESVAGLRDLFVQMVDASAYTAMTGLTVSVEIVKAGGSAYAAIAGTAAEIGSGTYKISLAAGDLDTEGDAMIKATATGAADQFVPIRVMQIADEIHQAKAILANDAVYTFESSNDDAGTLRILDDDGTTLCTLTPYESIAITGADWTESTKLITQVGAFLNYRHTTGDLITITAGAVAAQYTIADKIDDDTIELATDCNDAGGDITDDSVVGVITTGRLMRVAT